MTHSVERISNEYNTEFDGVVTNEGDIMPAADFRDADGDLIEVDHTERDYTRPSEHETVQKLSFDAQVAIMTIDAGIARSKAGGYSLIKVDGVGLGRYLTTRLPKTLSSEERRQIRDTYLPLCEVPVARQAIRVVSRDEKPWEGSDWAQRASGEYLDR